MLAEDEIFRENYVKIRLTCPRCKKERFLKVPRELTKHSEHLTTISIPSDFVCKHSFQAFIDRDFNVRAYQNADFEITKIEFYESGSKPEENIVTYSISLLMNSIIDILREGLIHKEILGGAIFNLEGKVIYSSLPDDIFIIMANQFEIQKDPNQKSIKQTILILENDQKLLSRVVQLKDIAIILILLFNYDVDLNQANTYQKAFNEKITDLEKPKPEMVKKEIVEEEVKKAPSQYWIYSKVNYSTSLQDGDTIYIESLGVNVSKFVILNLDEIKKNNQEFKGKIYFTQKYVNLMSGLALTLKDAAIFMNKLNKMP